MKNDVSWFPFNILQDAWTVQDADEEIFLLYSQLQSSSTTSDAEITASALGSVDSRKGVISVQIGYHPLLPHDSGKQTQSSEPSHLQTSKRRKNASRTRGKQASKQASLEIQLFQDTTALRSRKGDTGSVVWRASIHLARLLLSQPSSGATPPLPTTSLSSCHVLELGSGTGILGIVLAPLVAHYTVTDLPVLLPLIRKNLEQNLSPSELSKTTITDIDWVQLHDTPTQFRHKIFSPNNIWNPHAKHLSKRQSSTQRTAPSVQLSGSDSQRQIDLIIAVDCIYNPSLIVPLLDTINYLATLDSHIKSRSEADVDINKRPLLSPPVLIVLELRSAEVSREFLHAWLELPGRWEIWSVPLLGPRFAMWVGRRNDG